MQKKKSTMALGIILFAVFSLVIGASYAYFSVLFNDTRENGNTNVNTGNITNATIVSNVPDGIGTFSELDIYPGHKEVLGLSVTGSGIVGSKSYFQFKYKVSENGLGQNVKISVYESDIPIGIQENHFNCVKKNEHIEGSNNTKYFETCEEKNVGKLLEETILTRGEEDIVIGKDTITIKNENEDVTKYYYVVVEFINKEESQNDLMNHSLVGKVEVELTTPFELPKAVSEQNLEYLLSKKVEGQIIEDDETIDHNLRYIGSNPNNYVSFNNELWRIIGVMNNIDDGTGKKESRIKLIRNESIGNYSWDTSASNINDGRGINEWSQSDMMKLLNPGYESETVGGSLYWNKGSGTCYSGWKNIITTFCDFTSSGLSENAKRLIGNTLWNTGSNGIEMSWNNILSTKFYELERSYNTGKICTSGTYCNDNVERTTEWTGKLGLMYPSDYGYATSGGSTTSRESCLNTVLYNWSSLDDCYRNDWLYNGSTWQWTIMSSADSSHASSMFYVYTSGSVIFNSYAYGAGISRPVGYLVSNAKIVSGEGNINNPFILSEE